jgi:hypothetical protein
MELIISTLILIISLICFFLSRKDYKKLVDKEAALSQRFSPINFEKNILTKVALKYKNLQSSYKDSLRSLKENERKLSCYELGVGSMDLTSYAPLYDTEELSLLEDKLAQVKLNIKALLKNKVACVCNFGKDVTVNGRRRGATKLFNREIKLRLRCLDNEAKSALALVDWNNINRLVERLEDSFTNINLSGGIVKTFIGRKYLDYKVIELRLAYEISQLKIDIKEEMREEKRLIREAEREDEKIKLAAEKSVNARETMEKLVARELSKLESASEEQKELLVLHQAELAILKDKEQRAVSMAQVTKAGYVYIISNELSFGDGVCKIGMTRRVDPQDRVKELGDASVPELFNVHAFIYSENAPKLEKHLHKCFIKERVNLVNSRKEFFYVEPEKVISELKQYDEQIDIDVFEVETSSKLYINEDEPLEMALNPVLDIKPCKPEFVDDSEESDEVTQQINNNEKLFVGDSEYVIEMSKNEVLKKLCLTLQYIISNKKADSGLGSNVSIKVYNSKIDNEFFSPSLKNKGGITTELQDIISTIDLEKIDYLRRSKDKALFDNYIKNENYKIAVIKGREIIFKQRKSFTE